jgi:hypothetical protein
MYSQTSNLYEGGETLVEYLKPIDYNTPYTVGAMGIATSSVVKNHHH